MFRNRTIGHSTYNICLEIMTVSSHGDEDIDGHVVRLLPHCQVPHYWSLTAALSDCHFVRQVPHCWSLTATLSDCHIVRQVPHCWSLTASLSDCHIVRQEPHCWSLTATLSDESHIVGHWLPYCQAGATLLVSDCHIVRLPYWRTGATLVVIDCLIVRQEPRWWSLTALLSGGCHIGGQWLPHCQAAILSDRCHIISQWLPHYQTAVLSDRCHIVGHWLPYYQTGATLLVVDCLIVRQVPHCCWTVWHFFTTLLGGRNIVW